VKLTGSLGVGTVSFVNGGSATRTLFDGELRIDDGKGSLIATVAQKLSEDIHGDPADMRFIELNGDYSPIDRWGVGAGLTYGDLKLIAAAPFPDRAFFEGKASLFYELPMSHREDRITLTYSHHQSAGSLPALTVDRVIFGASVSLR